MYFDCLSCDKVSWDGAVLTAFYPLRANHIESNENYVVRDAICVLQEGRNLLLSGTVHDHTQKQSKNKI